MNVLSKTILSNSKKHAFELVFTAVFTLYCCLPLIFSSTKFDILYGFPLGFIWLIFWTAYAEANWVVAFLLAVLIGYLLSRIIRLFWKKGETGRLLVMAFLIVNACGFEMLGIGIAGLHIGH